MAHTRMLMREWGERVSALGESQADREELVKLIGLSPGGAAQELGLTRQRIYQMLQTGVLDGVYLIDSRGTKPHVIMVTDESLTRLLRSRNPGVQQDLLFKKSHRKVSGSRG